MRTTTRGQRYRKCTVSVSLNAASSGRAAASTALDVGELQELSLHLLADWAAEASAGGRGATCPPWCMRHEVSDEGHPVDEALTHHHEEWNIGREYIRLTRTDWADGAQEVALLLGEDELTPDQARVLSAALVEAATAAEAASESPGRVQS